MGLGFIAFVFRRVQTISNRERGREGDETRRIFTDYELLEDAELDL